MPGFPVMGEARMLSLPPLREHFHSRNLTVPFSAVYKCAAVACGPSSGHPPFQQVAATDSAGQGRFSLIQQRTRKRIKMEIRPYVQVM